MKDPNHDIKKFCYVFSIVCPHQDFLKPNHTPLDVYVCDYHVLMSTSVNRFMIKQIYPPIIRGFSLYHRTKESLQTRGVSPLDSGE